MGNERVGDVSNVPTTINRLTDSVFSTPPPPLRSADCVKQQCGFIGRNPAQLRGRKGQHAAYGGPCRVDADPWPSSGAADAPREGWPCRA